MPHIYTTDSTQLNFRVLGKGKKVLLLIHGWMVSGKIYDPILNSIDLNGLRVIVPDLRGTGGSGQPDGGYSIAQYAEDVTLILENEGVKDVAVVGHSMGGQIAQWLAIHHAQMLSGIILLCPVPARGSSLPPELKGEFRESAGRRDVQGKILDMACKELKAADREWILDDAARIPSPCIQESFDAWSMGGFESSLNQIKCPTLCVATDDPTLPVSELGDNVKKRILGCRLVYLPGPGHYVQVERPKETAVIIESFLSGLGF